MGRDYSLDIILNAEPKEKNLRIILQQGINAGISYTSSKESFEWHEVTKLNLEQALAILLTRLKGPCNFDNPGLVIFFKNSYSFFLVNDRYGCLKLTIGPIGTLLKKSSLHDTSLDFDPYIRTLLDMCKNFPIRELNTIDDYHMNSGVMLAEYNERDAVSEKENALRITLDIDETYDNFYKLFKKGHELGISYFKAYDLAHSNALELEEIIQKTLGIFKKPCEIRRVFREKAQFLIKKDGVYCTLTFGVSPHEPCPVLVIKPCTHILYKESEIDFDTYIRLALDWCHDFLILELTTCHGAE